MGLAADGFEISMYFYVKVYFQKYFISENKVHCVLNRARTLTTTEFLENGAIISGNMNIAEHFFANIGPTLAEGIPAKSDRHVESFMGDRVTDSIFLNPVTDEELLNIVHNAKDKKSKGYDGIDMCKLNKIIPHILTPLRHICNTSLSQGVFLMR